MPKKFWRFRNQADGSAELLLYGDISERSWWGDDVTPKQFADELSALGTVSSISVRINSGGGDVFAAQAIGNLLEQHPAKVTARIDGLCASSATIVACHCDKVIAANDSTYMIHPVRMGVFDYVDSTVLQQCINALAAVRENIVSLYARKTCREKDEVAGWMDATSWWTGEQAREKGFVDELTDSGTPDYENRSGMLFVNNVDTGLPFDKAPAFIRQNIENHIISKTIKEDAEMEIKNAADLRREYPELVNQIEQEAARNAEQAERRRIQDIEEMALPGSEEVTGRAKFTEPISAADYAKAAIKHARTQGAAYLKNVDEDVKNSGIGQVANQASDPAVGGDEFMNAIKNFGVQK